MLGLFYKCPLHRIDRKVYVVEKSHIIHHLMITVKAVHGNYYYKVHVYKYKRHLINKEETDDQR